MKTSTIGLGVAGVIAASLVYLWVKKPAEADNGDGDGDGDTGFVVQSVVCSPASVQVGSPVTITVNIANMDAVDGTCRIYVYVLNDLAETVYQYQIREYIPAGQSKVNVWSYTPILEGDYYACAQDICDSFAVI